MREELRSHLTYANLMATIAVFLVLSGGTAVALSGSNTVFSDDIANDTFNSPTQGQGGLVAADLRPNSVATSEVANGSITGADIASSALPKGQSTSSGCNPNSSTFVDCGTLTVNLPRAGLRILVVASAMWFSDQLAPGAGVYSSTRGTCRIGVNGAPFGPDAEAGERQDVTDVNARQSLTLTTVTDPNLGAGNHTIGLACRQVSGDIMFTPTYVSAVVLGPG